MYFVAVTYIIYIQQSFRGAALRGKTTG